MINATLSKKAPREEQQGAEAAWFHSTREGAEKGYRESQSGIGPCRVLNNNDKNKGSQRLLGAY